MYLMADYIHIWMLWSNCDSNLHGDRCLNFAPFVVEVNISYICCLLFILQMSPFPLLFYFPMALVRFIFWTRTMMPFTLLWSSWWLSARMTLSESSFLRLLARQKLTPRSLPWSVSAANSGLGLVPYCPERVPRDFCASAYPHFDTDVLVGSSM